VRNKKKFSKTRKKVTIGKTKHTYVAIVSHIVYEKKMKMFFQLMLSIGRIARGHDSHKNLFCMYLKNNSTSSF